MKYTSKMIAIGALLGLLITPAMADLNVGAAQITRVGGFFDGSGGEFTIGDNLTLTNAAYSLASPTKGIGTIQGSFQTFCMERNENVNIPQTVYIRISETFIDESTGAVTGPGSHAEFGGNTYGDNLDARTAYLYTQFATGNLAGYDYTPAGREQAARNLQNAIWYIEGEGGAFNSFVSLANTAVASGGEWEGRGIGRVRVLNLFGDSGFTSHLQDQLYLSVPVPGAALLGMLGLAGIAGLRRRLA